jgi:hypothetical protein
MIKMLSQAPKGGRCGAPPVTLKIQVGPPPLSLPPPSSLLLVSSFLLLPPHFSSFLPPFLPSFLHSFLPPSLLLVLHPENFNLNILILKTSKINFFSGYGKRLSVRV